MRVVECDACDFKGPNPIGQDVCPACGCDVLIPVSVVAQLLARGMRNCGSNADWADDAVTLAGCNRSDHQLVIVDTGPDYGEAYGSVLYIDRTTEEDGDAMIRLLGTVHTLDAGRTLVGTLVRIGLALDDGSDPAELVQVLADVLGWDAESVGRNGQRVIAAAREQA